LYSSHLAEELGKFRDLVVEAKDKGVEIAAAVAKKMLDENMLIFGAVDETSATKTIHQLTELQNARVRFAYEKLICDTSINQFIHLDMGKEVDLNSLDKMSIEYAEAKKRAVEGMLLYMNCLGAIFFISLSFTIGAVSLPSHL
jgi:snRNA-activating protein complex subunit 1